MDILTTKIFRFNDENIILKLSNSGRKEIWNSLWATSFVLGNIISNKAKSLRVLEIGSGYGLCSLVAAKNGCDVTMSDINEEAIKAGMSNAKENGVDIKAVRLNWHEHDKINFESFFDIIMGSDVLYMGNSTKPIAKLLKSYLKDDGVAIFVDPGRCNVSKFIDNCNEYEFKTFKSTKENVETSICTLKSCEIVLVFKEETLLVRDLISFIDENVFTNHYNKDYGFCL
jgi:predicted nicotinamide N-methyase